MAAPCQQWVRQLKRLKWCLFCYLKGTRTVQHVAQVETKKHDFMKKDLKCQHANNIPYMSIIYCLLGNHLVRTNLWCNIHVECCEYTRTSSAFNINRSGICLQATARVHTNKNAAWLHAWRMAGYASRYENVIWPYWPWKERRNTHPNTQYFGWQWKRAANRW